MSRFFNFLGGGRSSEDFQNGVAAIFPMALQMPIFVEHDIVATYTKILTDTLERTHGLSEEMQAILFDNCLSSEASRGLIHHLVFAMLKKSDLFLVYNRALGVLRKADGVETEQIRRDYEKQGTSKLGVYVSFKLYRRTDMMVIFSELEYLILNSLYKTVNISKAVQVKVSDMRASTSLADADVAIGQARAIAHALRMGQDVLLDAKDDVTTATPTIDPTEKSIAFLNGKRAYYLDLPLAYVVGEMTPGIGSTGEADTRALERGLKQYFFSIIKPVLEALFPDAEIEFRSQDFRQVSTALEALKSFELTSDEYLSRESKRDILARLFAVDPDEEKERLEEEGADEIAPAPVPAPNPAAAPEVANNSEAQAKQSA